MPRCGQPGHILGGRGGDIIKQGLFFFFQRDAGNARIGCRGVEFAAEGKDLFAGYLYAHRLDLLFIERVKLFKHVELFHLSGKFPNLAFRQRMYHGKLQK